MTSAEWESGEAPSQEKQRDFYQKIRSQIRKWAEGKDASTHKVFELILAAPDLFHLVCKLTADSRVPTKEKTKLALVLAYFISPIDLLPEAFLGPVGYADDVVLAAMVVNALIKHGGEEVVREHWAGEEDVLVFLEGILATMDEKINTKVLDKLRRLVG